MTDADILKEIQAEARKVESRVELGCERALALANRLGVSPAVIGRLCNESDVRIVSCQLGCFP